MLAACPAARESGDLGPRENVPHVLRSVSEPAADGAAVEALEQGGLARRSGPDGPPLSGQVGLCGIWCQCSLISLIMLAQCSLGRV